MCAEGGGVCYGGGKGVTVGLCGVVTGWSVVKCNCWYVYKVFGCDIADRIVGGGVYSGVARPFEGRDEQ